MISTSKVHKLITFREGSEATQCTKDYAALILVNLNAYGCILKDVIASAGFEEGTLQKPIPVT